MRPRATLLFPAVCAAFAIVVPTAAAVEEPAPRPAGAWRDFSADGAWQLASRHTSAARPGVASGDSGMVSPDLAALTDGAEWAATAPPQLMARRMQEELDRFTGDMSCAAAYLLSQLQ